MSLPYRVTLLQLKADLSDLGAATDKIELGQKTPDEIYALAAKLLKVNVAGQPKAEPAILVYRGEKGWRIVARSGLIRMHESTSSLDDYWTVDTPQGLAQLPPFRGVHSTPPVGGGKVLAGPRSGSGQRGVLRTMAEVAGLVGLGVVLLAVGLWYGVPHKRLRDVPDDVVILDSTAERESVFKAVAGTYATGRKPGDGVIVITAQGHVTLGALGRNGQPITPPRLAEDARAGRRNQAACLVTSFGIIAAAGEPDVVTVGNYKWRRVTLN